MTYWKFIKNKNGFEITKSDNNKKPYSLGTLKANLMISMMHIAHNFQEGDIIDTCKTKEDLVFWHKDYNSYVLMKKGFTNNTVWFPNKAGRSVYPYLGEN